MAIAVWTDQKKRMAAEKSRSVAWLSVQTGNIREEQSRAEQSSVVQLGKLVAYCQKVCDTAVPTARITRPCHSHCRVTKLHLLL